MAEALGATSALVSAFNDAVQFFHYIECGRRFGSDLETSMIILNSTGMRLTRWGHATGLTGEMTDQRTLEGKIQDQDICKVAGEQLGHINNLIKEVRRQSLDYGDAAGEADEECTTLCERMREVSIKRSKNTKLIKKVGWVLSGRDKMQETIEQIVQLVNTLIDLCPAKPQDLQKAADEELEVLGKDLVAKIMKRLAKMEEAQDKPLQAAMEKVEKNSANYQGATLGGTVNYGSNNTGIQGSWNNFSGGTLNFGGSKKSD